MKRRIINKAWKGWTEDEIYYGCLSFMNARDLSKTKNIGRRYEKIWRSRNSQPHIKTYPKELPF